MGASSEINREMSVSAPTGSVASEQVIAAATDCGYAVAASGPSQYQLTRAYRPGWVVPVAIVAGLLTLGVGLLLLVVVKKQNETCSIKVVESERGTAIRVNGTVSAELMSRLDQQMSAGNGPSTPAPSSPIVPPPNTPPRSAFLVEGPPPQATGRPVAPQPLIASVPTISSLPGRDTRTGGPPADPPVDHTIARSSIGVPAGDKTEADAPSRWALRIGPEMHTLADGLVIGRNPVAPDEVPAAVRLAIQDRGLSKTHLLMRVIGDSLEVRDLASTNGTSLRRAEVTSTVGADAWTALDSGVELLFGDQVARVERQ